MKWLGLQLRTKFLHLTIVHTYIHTTHHIIMYVYIMHIHIHIHSLAPRLSVRPSTCSHLTPVGQELCYLCHQRALRNIPIDVTQERREKERTEDKMLQEYQHQRDLLALAREQAIRKRNCQYNREIASFNLDAAKKKVYITITFSSSVEVVE